MKNKKGITLIALIITIIVLLILAGVSISILTGENGVLTQAQESTEKTKRVKLQELHDLTSANAAMNLEGYTYTDRTGKSVYIPSGFEVSQVTREVAEVKNGELQVENEVDSGLVIIDKMGDEFVWIPATTDNFVKKKCLNYHDIGVSSASDMVNLDDKYGANYFITSKVQEKNNVIKAGGYFVSRYEIGADGSTQRALMGSDDINYYQKNGVTDDTKYWKDARETDITAENTEKRQAIIDRILPSLTSKQGIEPVRRISQDECLVLANLWKKGKDYQSGLITGTQWDRMVSFICDDNSSLTEFNTSNDNTINISNKDSSSWGNYGLSTKSTTYKQIFTSDGGKWVLRQNNFYRSKIDGSQSYIFPTGNFITDSGRDTKMKNVYDVAGNVWEWTTEIHKTNGENCIMRGGSADNKGSDNSATYRFGAYPSTSNSYSNVGFRVVIYVI